MEVQLGLLVDCNKKRLR